MAGKAYCPDCGADILTFEPHSRTCKSREAAREVTVNNDMGDDPDGDDAERDHIAALVEGAAREATQPAPNDCYYLSVKELEEPRRAGTVALEACKRALSLSRLYRPRVLEIRGLAELPALPTPPAPTVAERLQDIDTATERLERVARGEATPPTLGVTFPEDFDKFIPMAVPAPPAGERRASLLEEIADAHGVDELVRVRNKIVRFLNTHASPQTVQCRSCGERNEVCDLTCWACHADLQYAKETQRECSAPAGETARFDGPFCPGECIGNYVDPATGKRYPCEHQQAGETARADAREIRRRTGVELDNHHNALACPYCNPERLKFCPDPKAHEASVAGETARERIAKVEWGYDALVGEPGHSRRRGEE